MTDRYEIPERIRLLGDVHAMLTVAEANEWSEFARDQQAYKDYDIASREAGVLRAAVLGGATDRAAELLSASKRMDELHDVMHDIATKWYADLIAKDKHRAEIVGTDSAKYRTD